MSECDDAKADLRRAEERLNSAIDWVSSATSAVGTAEDLHESAQYAHRRAISAAEGFDSAVREADAEVGRAQATLTDAERNYDASNRETYLAELRKVLHNAEWSLRDANDKSKEAWNDVATQAREEEHALTAVTTAKNKLSLAEEDRAGAKAWVAEATKAVDKACS